MFKGTNKMWKGIVSAALALTMLSTVAFAAETTNTITVTGDWVVYDGEANTVTVTGSISDAEADVTILAVRDAAAVDTATLATWTDETLKGKVVYIDQEAFENGAFKFQFIPRSGIKGGKMTIFVGGENVSEVKSYTIDAAVKAPDVVPVEPWYEGEDLKLNIYKAGTTDVYGDEVAVAGWFDSINSFKVNGDDDDNEVTGYTRSGNVITVPGVTAPATAIAITTTDGDYSPEEWSGSVAQVKKPAGTITADAASITAGDAATFTVAESSVEGWLAAAAANVKVDGADADATLTGTTLTVTLPALGDVDESKEYTVTVEVPNYEVATAKVTAVAPTKLAADALVAPKAVYSTTEFAEEVPADFEGTDEEKAELYGKASVVLPATEEAYGTTIAWTIDGVDAEGTVPLTRALSTDEEPDTTVEAVATISKAGYTAVTKTFTITVKQCGDDAKVAPENVTNLTASAFGIEGAKVATIKLEKGTIDPETQNIVVGDTAFMYAPERSTGEVDVFVAILRANNADAAAVADAAEFGNEASAKLYYGKVSAPSNAAAMNNFDPAQALKIAKLRNVYSADYTDAQYLATDVTGSGSVTNFTTGAILKARKSGDKAANFTILTK